MFFGYKFVNLLFCWSYIELASALQLVILELGANSASGFSAEYSLGDSSRGSFAVIYGRTEEAEEKVALPAKTCLRG